MEKQKIISAAKSIAALGKSWKKYGGKSRGHLANELTLAFPTRSFQKSSFSFLDKVYLTQIYLKKGACFFFLWQKPKILLCKKFFKNPFFHVQMFNFANIFKSLTEFSTNKKSTQITNNYFVERCMKNNYFSITNITRWVGFQKKLNC